MALNTAGDWQLESGVWTIDSTRPGLEYTRSAVALPVADNLTREDIGRLMRAGRLPRDPALHFPPEFNYCPVSGDGLAPAPAAPSSTAWVGPFGAMPLGPAARQGVAGLRHTAMPLALAAGERHADGMPERSLAAPPPGDYEFFSATFGTVDAALLCVDPRKGTVRAWLPASEQWAELHPRSALLLEVSTVPSRGWRAEMAYAFSSRLYLPTKRGLACIAPDVPSLSYDVEYIGGGPSVAAPIAFGGKVWGPVRSGAGIDIVGVDGAGLAGHAGQAVSVALQGDPGAASTPVYYNRLAVWPFENGQLLLRTEADQSLAASWLDWPKGLAPVFAFGCPYQSSEGEFWQLCFDSAINAYVYVLLGTEAFERMPVGAPRFCSGKVSYRFAARMKDAPWIEPESGDDASNNFVIPLLETAAGNVVGVKIEANTGLGEVLESDQRLRAVLLFEDRDGQVAFHTIAVAQPWRTRVFRHDGALWVYHPAANAKPIDGWNVLS